MNRSYTRVFWAWLPICIFFMYQFILRVSPNVMMREILSHFRITATDFGVLTSLYYLGYASMQVPIGILLDRYGPRYISSFFALLCAVGAVLFAFSDSWAMALFARFLIGVGSSGAFISSTKLIRTWAPEKYFSLFMSITVTAGLLTAHQSGHINSYIMTNVGWQKTMLYLSVGGLLLCGGLYALVMNNPKGDDKENIRLNLPFFKMIFDKLKEHKIIWLGIWGCLLTGPLYVLGDVWGISFYESVFSYTKEEATNVSTIIYFGMACGGPLIAALSEKIHTHRKNFIGLLGALMALILIVEIIYKPNYAVVMTLNFLMGAFSSYQIILFGLVVLNIPQNISAITFGIVNTINMLSGFFYLPLVGWLLDFFWSGQSENGIRIYSSFAYQASLSSIAIGLILGALGFFTLRLKRA